MLEKIKIKDSNQKCQLKKLLQDTDNLEKFYTDKEFRTKLVSSPRYLYWSKTKTSKRN
jgi:hypothetical protein